MNINQMPGNQPSKSFGLTADAKDYILKTLGSQSQDLIDKYEAAEQQQAGYSPMPSSLPGTTGSGTAQATGMSQGPVSGIDDLLNRYQSGSLSGFNTAVTGAELLKNMTPNRKNNVLNEARKLFLALQNDKQVGEASRIGLGITGDVNYPRQVSHESMIHRSDRDSRPDNTLLPGCFAVLENMEASKPEDLTDLCDKALDAIPYDNERPMEKLYAGIRMLLALSVSTGKVDADGNPEKVNSFLTNSLSNLQTDAQDDMIAKVGVGSVKESFAYFKKSIAMKNEAQEMIQATVTDQQKPADRKIEVSSNKVTIGGVELKRRTRDDD